MAKPKFLSLDGVRTLVTYVKEKLATKVDKEPGKSLSDNNYSDADVAKLESIESGAQENIIESISVNSVAQAVNEKNVNIAIPLVDATLKNAGQSADAKTTGDAIAGVNQSLTRTATAIRQEFDDADTQLANEFTEAMDQMDTSIRDDFDNADTVLKNELITAIQDVADAIPTKISDLTNDGDYTTKGYVDDEIADAVAAIPTKTSQITNDSDYTTKRYVDGELDTLEASIPTKVSQLQNDSSYATTAQLTDGLATKEDALQYGTATAEDVGKAMIPKTVESGKVTSWEFGEAGKVDDVQINGTSILNNKTANIPLATDSTLGVVKSNASGGVVVGNTGLLQTDAATVNHTKLASDGHKPITPSTEHSAAFYGLAKASGDTTQSASNNAVGVYTMEAKSAIQSMLGIDTAIADAVGDITSFEFQVVTELPATGTKGVIYLVAHTHDTNDGYDEYIWITDKYERLGTLDVDLSDYATTQYVDDELAIKVDDVTVNGTSIVSNGVAEIPVATNSTFGAVRTSPQFGTKMVTTANGTWLGVEFALSDEIKNPSNSSTHVIVPRYQHESTFYGLAKAAGDATQSSSANAVGTYTDSAKASIKNMLGFATTSDISNAIDNLVSTRYHVCGTGEYNTTTYIPTLTGELGVIYLVPKPANSLSNEMTETSNIYYEFIYTGSAFEKIGDTKLDLSDYVTAADIATNAAVTAMLNQVFP